MIKSKDTPAAPAPRYDRNAGGVWRLNPDGSRVLVEPPTAPPPRTTFTDGDPAPAPAGAAADKE